MNIERMIETSSRKSERLSCFHSLNALSGHADGTLYHFVKTAQFPASIRTASLTPRSTPSGFAARLHRPRRPGDPIEMAITVTQNDAIGPKRTSRERAPRRHLIALALVCRMNRTRGPGRPSHEERPEQPASAVLFVRQVFNGLRLLRPIQWRWRCL